MAISTTYLDEKGMKNLDLEINPRTLGKKTGAMASITDKKSSDNTILAVNPEQALALSSDNPDAQIYSVMNNTDLINVHSEKLENTIVAVLNNLEQEPSDALINEIKDKVSEDITIIAPHNKDITHIQEEINTAITDTIEKIDIELTDNEDIKALVDTDIENPELSTELEKNDKVSDVALDDDRFILNEDSLDTEIDKYHNLEDKEIEFNEEPDIADLQNDLESYESMNLEL